MQLCPLRVLDDIVAVVAAENSDGFLLGKAGCDAADSSAVMQLKLSELCIAAAAAAGAGGVADDM